MVGLAFAFDLVTLTGAIIAWPLLLRRVGSLDGWRITRSLVRMFLATLPGLLFAFVVMAVVGSFLHQGPLYGLVVTVVGGGGALLLYALCCADPRHRGVPHPDAVRRGAGSGSDGDDSDDRLRNNIGHRPTQQRTRVSERATLAVVAYNGRGALSSA